MKVTALILAAGGGTRMLSSTPKVLHKIASQPILEFIIQVANAVADAVVVVASNDLLQHNEFQKLLKKHSVIYTIQKEPLGTADAVKSAEHLLDGEYTLILCGDVPLIEPSTLQKMCLSAENNDVVILGFQLDEENQYGRVMLENGIPYRIVEYKEYNNQAELSTICNSGILLVKTSLLKEFLNQIQNTNNSHEYYLTDLIEYAYAHRDLYKNCLIIASDNDELVGINNKQQLSYAEKIIQQRLRSNLLKNGVILLDPETVFLTPTVIAEKDVIIHQCVVFGHDVTIESGATILPFSHIEGAKISKGCTIGPFARIRPNTYLGPMSKIGNFVEIKNSYIEQNAKASHLSYIGDAELDQNVNIGAGTIFCNYDGKKKHNSKIGKNSFIGSNTSIISPVEIGENVLIGAGSVINQNVPSDHIAVARAKQRNIKKK